MNPQLEAAIDWWLRELPRLPHRVVLNSAFTRKVVVSYSDGEGAYAQVGIAAWTQGQKIGRAGVIRVPDHLRRMWDTKRACERYNDMFEVEAILGLS